MRMAFGLVSLLVAVGIILWLYGNYTAPVAKQGSAAREQAQQMAGRDETGAAATESLTLEPRQRSGKVDGMRVASITPGGAMATFYGLRQDDIILQAGDMPFTDPVGGDVELAEAMLLEAYKAQKPLRVLRGTEQITLPAPAGSANAPPPQPGPAGGLQKQLDQIRNPQEQ